MKQRLHDLNNSNADAMVVPLQEGHDEDDNYFGSIGDATMQHIQSLSTSQRQMWEEIYSSKDGKLFRFEASTNFFDVDPMQLESVDLEEYKKEFLTKLSPSEAAVLMEAVEEEETRRENSQDIWEHSDLIPYSDWKDNPGMGSKVMTGRSPKDRACYMGTTTQVFYDDFPEGHPDADLINTVLMMLNKEEEELTPNYLKWIEKTTNSFRFHSKYVEKAIYFLLEGLCLEQDPEVIIPKCLKFIDKCWAKEYRNQAAKMAMTDPIRKAINQKKMQWKKMDKEGKSVYSLVCKFGREMFIFSRRNKGKINTTHWAMYHGLKIKYSPALMIQGIDVNRCTRGYLRVLTREEYGCCPKADSIFFARPIKDIKTLRDMKVLSYTAFSDGTEMEKLLQYIDEQGEKACKQKGKGNFAKIAKVLTLAQILGTVNLKGEKLKLSEGQWKQVWGYYRLLRSEVQLATVQEMPGEISDEQYQYVAE